jgi:xyloglucan:xyloglucosyl transferase
MATARWPLAAAAAAAAAVAALLLVEVATAAAPRKPVDVPFQKNYVPTWAQDHIHYIDGGREVQLYLDKTTGTGFQTRGSYLFGHFSMHMKLVGGDSAGTVTAFYVRCYARASHCSAACDCFCCSVLCLALLAGV